MATEHIEIGPWVFRMDSTPDAEGHCRRRVTFTQVGGPRLSDAEWDRITKELAAELVANGTDLVAWGHGEAGDDDAPRGAGGAE